MKISALRLFNVKCFAGRGVAIEGIGDGVNVLCAANEFGKSTSFEALHALFFQPHSSVSSDVKNLRPYSGGNPLVEADIATPDGRFRITKQYYGGRSTRVTDLSTGRLMAQADEAEAFIASLIGGGTAGPAGLLWVRQGTTGIERRSRSEEDGEKRVRASLLESVQGEVEAVTGGRRMAEIMAVAGEALAEFVTATGRLRASGRYVGAIEERDRLVAEERKLSGEVVALREALDRRAAGVKRLAEFDKAEDRQERRKAIEAAQAAFYAAKAQGETLRRAEAELKLARERRDGADRDLGTFRSAFDRAKKLQDALRKAEQRQGEAANRRRDVVDAIDRAKAEADAAETGERGARASLSRVEAALKAREASQRLIELKERLGRAEDTRRSLEEGEAQLALAKIPPKAVEELQELDVEIAKLRAVAEAARPSVAIAYEATGTGTVTMNGVPLGAGEERGYDGQAQLSVPGIGTITLRSNRPILGDDRLERAVAKRQTLLNSMGVDDLAAARDRQILAQEIGAELRELRGRLSLLAPEGLPRLREEMAAHDSVDAETLEPTEDPEQVRAVLDEAEDRRVKSRQALREVETQLTSAVDAVVEAETTAAGLRAEATQIDAILGPQERRTEREQVLSGGLDELARALAVAERQVESLRAEAVDLDSTEARLKRVRSVEEAAEKEANGLRQEIAELNGRIRTYADEAVEEKWRETAEAAAAAADRVDAFAREVKVLQRLGSALEGARSKARELYLKPVMAELKPLLGLLFDDVSITFDDKTLLPQTIRRNGQEEEVDRLSGGMREQLSVLTRLAFARLLARDGRPAPVILDDAMVYSDDDRIEKMFDALHRQSSKDQQIIVFSCRQRAFQKLGGNILKMTDWEV